MKENQKMSVKRDGEGLPSAWRILSPGTLTATENGKITTAEVSPEDIRVMADWHAQKGCRLPIDCEHYLYYIASSNKIPEAEFLKIFPTARGVVGDCDVVEKDGELWAENVQFSETAKPFIKSGILRYYSPVIYGLDGKCPKRITSLALTSNPSINNLKPLVASDTADHERGGAQIEPMIMSDCTDNQTNNPPTGRNPKMQMLLDYLQKWLGVDCPADMDDATAEGIIKAIEAKKEEEDEAKATAMSDQQKEIETLKSEVKVLSDANVSAQREALIKEGFATGKLTAAQEPWARGLTPAVLSDFLATAPVVVPTTKLASKTAENEPAVLTDVEKRMADKLGISHEDFAKSKGE